MKYLATLCVAALVAGVNSAAIAAAEPFCWRLGQPCDKVKRAAEAFAEAFDEPIAEAEAFDEPIAEAEASAFCWRPGQICEKAKRAALALAHTVADANPEAEAFFDKLAIDEAFPEPEAVADAEIADKVKREAEAEAFCWRPGQPCGKVKRAADAIASALAEPAPEPFCQRPGQLCGKVKRDAEAVAEAFCWRPGQPCGKAKREANALAEAAAEALEFGGLEKEQNSKRIFRPPHYTTTAIFPTDPRLFHHFHEEQPYDCRKVDPNCVTVEA
ncbi:hypothetical protein VC83_06943 [Pseudogymnoascus destructans]|uniref:Pheromone n=2 Tax=Pseudogymnoascus destructans TaxID=655981 RepID=L8FQZ5_PSED2|nr:uncharacterized protein VC83_06943 [Pseudogymnoascus destructans]ELR03405.1 hypothetical protein GMDG_06142 [Pseudogymnoascus destructans 20631-21]OAF56923.1 hypothetical protein VC83_06943 [Pseudogymnoascus destructans]